MVHTLTHTDLHLPGQDHVYHGKVRDVYFLRDGRIAMVATDRISAFDVVRWSSVATSRDLHGEPIRQVSAAYVVCLYPRG